MSDLKQLFEEDRLPRMVDHLKAGDLNTDACVTLAAEVLKEAANELTSAAVHAARHPSKENLAHLKGCRGFYASDWFEILSCGAVADGPGVAQQIIRMALRGTKVEETA
jgi:hypothetical protein